MTTDNRFDASALYDRYAVTIRLRDRINGGVPKNSAVIEKWVKARTGFDDELTKAQTEEALKTQTEDVAEGMWTGFPRDENGLFIWTRQIKAMLRESAVLLGITKKKRGSRQIIQHGFEIKNPDGGDRIPLGVEEPTGSEEGPIHVMTAQGPRSALKRQDYVETPTLRFEIWVLTTAAQETRHIGEKDIVRMLTHAQENGLGASRSQGHGKFDVVEFGSASD